MTQILDLTLLSKEMVRVASLSNSYIKVLGRGGEVIVVVGLDCRKDDVKLGVYKVDAVRKGLRSRQWSVLEAKVTQYIRRFN